MRGWEHTHEMQMKSNIFRNISLEVVHVLQTELQQDSHTKKNLPALQLWHGRARPRVDTVRRKSDTNAHKACTCNKHRDDENTVVSACFFLGKFWSNLAFSSVSSPVSAPLHFAIWTLFSTIIKGPIPALGIPPPLLGTTAKGSPAPTAVHSLRSPKTRSNTSLSALFGAYSDSLLGRNSRRH